MPVPLLYTVFPLIVRVGTSDIDPIVLVVHRNPPGRPYTVLPVNCAWSLVLSV